MTDEEMQIAIADASKSSDRWVLVKCGRYYNPETHDYTFNINEAWVVTGETADKYDGTYVMDKREPGADRIKKYPLPPPDYLNDLNAMRSAVLSQSDAFQSQFDFDLKQTFNIASLTARDWAEIFLGIKQ